MPKKSGLVTPLEVEIGQRVKRFRDQINWPQPAFAAELGISRDKLASIEYGRTPLRYDIGYRLCFVFDVNYRWLTAGEGEIKATTGSLELPRPEDAPRRALFSQVCEAKRTKRAAGKKDRADGGLIKNFDAKSHVVDFLTDLLEKEKFRSPLEEQEFALEVTSYARELALRIRRAGTKERYLAVPENRKPAGAPPANLKESVRDLQQEIKRLNAAMERVNPLSVNPSALPRAAQGEVARVQEAIEKIVRQLEEAESTIKALAKK